MLLRPLLNSEKIEDIQLAVDTMVKAYGPPLKRFIDEGNKSIEILKKYGRFPTRNQDLGRTNTKEEDEYIEKLA